MAGEKKQALINKATNFGATIVIIGLLFKIQHYPGSEIFICLGLGAEALLFFLMGFRDEPKEVDWARVYPELADDYQGGAPTAKKKENATATVASLDSMIANAKIGPEVLKSLGDGLKTFGDKVNSISKVADAGAATEEFAAKVKNASNTYETLSTSINANINNLNTAFAKATTDLAQFASAGGDTKAYHDEVNKLAKNLSQLNAVYELELQDSSVHLKSMNKFYQNLSATMSNFNESLDDSKNFKEEVNKLAKNLASLNSVYGNMLSAMNQPRV